MTRRLVFFYFLVLLCTSGVNGQDVGTMGQDLYEFLKKIIETLTTTNWGSECFRCLYFYLSIMYVFGNQI